MIRIARNEQKEKQPMINSHTQEIYAQSQQNYFLYSFADLENKYCLRELIWIVIN